MASPANRMTVPEPGAGRSGAASAVERARAEHGRIEGVRWLRLDIERDDPAQLGEDSYDLTGPRQLTFSSARR
ncbi:hypothetical protein ACH4E7_41530 [Kitasatospora sp. NPDC018058]|uniref:hypothetical protein n=1 Tax=Kitasatospora sp. NPDC018058 TaxID=3364025 RepID=UPI0037C06895